MRGIVGVLLVCPSALAYAQSPYRSYPAGVHCHGDRMVWLNTATEVYHFAGNLNFGASGQGAFMCEHEAVERGARPGVSDQ